jgi:sugar phosphate isomerase/epimerase
MKIGIFAKTFAAQGALPVLAAVRDAGYDTCQFNLACAGLPALPDAVPPAIIAAIAEARAATGVSIAALSGTANLIHPDAAVRELGLQRLAVVIAAAAELGVPMVTLCTGTRDPDDPWRHHPGNTAPEAWADLLASLRTASAHARTLGIQLGIEPEPGNIVDSAATAARLLAELPDAPLGIVLDPANVIEGAAPADATAIVAAAISLLAPAIALVHAKDRNAAGAVVPAGRGIVDFPAMFACLARHGVEVPVITHGLDEADAAPVARYLRGLM